MNMDGTSCLSAELVSKPDDDHKDKLISQCQPVVVAQHQKAAPPREPDGWFEYIEPPVEFQDYEAKLRAGEASIKRSSAPVKKHIELLKLEAIISSFVSKLVQSTFQEVWLLQRKRLQTGDTKPLAHTYVNLAAEVTTAIAEEPNARAAEVIQRKPVTVCHLFSLSEDVYNVPVDAIDPQQPVRRRKTAGRTKATLEDHSLIAVRVSRREKPASADLHKRHSLAYPMANKNEPIHMTLEEVRGYLKEMHRSPGNVLRRPLLRASSQSSNGLLDCRRSLMLPSSSLDDEGSSKPRKRHSLFFYHLWMKKTRSATSEASLGANSSLRRLDLNSSLSINLKQVFCSVFKPKRTDNSVVTTSWTFSSPHQSYGVQQSAINRSPAPSPSLNTNRRALPPVPPLPAVLGETVLSSTQSLSFVEAEESSPLTSVRGRSKASSFDFATSIEAVKDYGWYWGPLSGEAAEKILSAEPDGSFIVRDSSDDHYIFSLTFKLSGCIRHVRIEHDHGNFSFGSVTKFKSQTIVEFIEKAVEHSRSGRYLFFLHRRPVLGPMRVQLLHPVSRFKHVQSLQHLCRFVILRLVRRDHTDQLPLPKPLRDYLNSMQYFSETLERSQSPLRTVEHFV